MERRAVHNALGHYPRFADRRSRNNISVVPKTQSTSDSLKGIWSDFVEKTTLLGISHSLKKKSFLWLFLYIICLSISVLQSWKAGEDLFSNRGTQVIMVESIPRVPLPSITFCSYALLPKNFSLSDHIKGYTELEHDHSCGSDNDSYEEIEKKNADLTLQFLRSKSEKQRANLSVNMLSIIHKCTFKENVCNYSAPEDFYFFNNPFYGNCFTFNPAFNSSRILVDLTTNVALFSGMFFPHVELSVWFRWNNSDWTTAENDKTRIGILMHSPGTAPVLESSSVSDFRPGDSVEYTLTLKLKLFKKELMTGCVDRTEEKYARKSKFYSIETPYLYSVDACMKSCAQKFTMKECKKIDAILPVQPNETGITTELPPISNCSILENVDMEQCGCPLPCEYISYDISMDTKKIQDDCGHTSKRKTELTKFSVNFMSTIVDIVKEEAAYSLTQFLGILGGNLSLWIGLCVISLLEVVELILKTIKVLIMSKSRQRKVKPEIPHGQQNFANEPDPTKKSNFGERLASFRRVWNRVK